MNERNGLIGGLAVLIGILLLLSFLGFRDEDTVSPEITYGEEPLYYDGADTENLLEGVSARDDKDGDVTASLMVAQIYDNGDGTGVVVYTAKDGANNVAMERREFRYQNTAPEEPADVPEDPEHGAGDGESTEPGADGETDDGSIGTNEEGYAIDSLGNLTDEAYEEFRAAQLEEGMPVVRLSEHQITLAVGESFNIYNYIDEVEDDVDTINTMLRMDRGGLDTDVPGSYVVTLYALDSDRNQSNMEYLEVTVE